MKISLAFLLLPLLVVQAAAQPPDTSSEVDAVYPQSEALYLDLHQHPELSLHEQQSAAKLAAGLRTGGVTVNDVIVPLAHPATPFGGRGASGWGVTQGAEGLLEMTVPQAVSLKGGSFRPHYDLASGKGIPDQAELLRTLLESAHAPTRDRRWRAWFRLMGGLWREVRAGIRKLRA